MKVKRNWLTFLLVIVDKNPPPTPTPPPATTAITTTTTEATTQTTTLPPGATCDDEPCQNGAECIMEGDEVFCFCSDGFEGLYCEISERLFGMLFISFLKISIFCLKSSCLQLYSSAVLCPHLVFSWARPLREFFPGGTKTDTGPP